MACFFCRNPGCQGFCNVYTRNQFGKLIHTEQGSQKAPWKSSRVTPSSKRHRHRLAGCTTVKTRPGSLRICFSSLVHMLTRGARLKKSCPLYLTLWSLGWIRLIREPESVYLKALIEKSGF